MGSPGNRRNVRWTALFAFVLVVAACSNSPNSPRPASVPEPTPAPVTEHVADNRFTVVLSGKALQEATSAGISLPALVARDLDHINALLPGPTTTITVFSSSPRSLIAQIGVNGYTDLETGHITIGFGPTPQASLHKALTWLAQALAHEVDHSVRILAGPGCGPTLLMEIVCEGISSAFDRAAFPRLPDPWDRAISRSQECALWKQAQPLLGQLGLYDAWMFGQPGIPHWTAFTIGYDIVTGYHQYHPGMSWSAITAATAATILAGSHYRPCSP
jgi:hypothetical protein